MNANTEYDQYVADMKSAWMQEDDDIPHVVPDGGVVIARMALMDSTQKALSDATDRPAVTDDSAVCQRLKDAQRDADKVQAYADAFTAKREAEQDNSPYSEYVRRLNDAWMGGAA